MEWEVIYYSFLLFPINIFDMFCVSIFWVRRYLKTKPRFESSNRGFYYIILNEVTLF